MAEMKDLNQTLLPMNLVVNHNRAVDQPTGTRSSAGDIPHTREPAEQIHVIEQGLAKAGSSLVVVLGDMPNNLGQIVQRSLREEDPVIHLGKSFRTSSMGTVRPASASRIPSSMAARVSSSSSSSIEVGSSKSILLASAILSRYRGSAGNANGWHHSWGDNRKDWVLALQVN
jgi:hypothetical protein